MTERPTHAPCFTRPHEQPEPNAVQHGRIFDGGSTRPAPPTVPPTGLHRVQDIGGYDGLDDEADSRP